MDLKQAFRNAMKAEIEGRELYRVAAEKSQDPKAGDVFTFLAGEEEAHLKALQDIYRQHLAGETIRVPRLPRPGSLEGSSPIFSEEFKTRLKDRHFEMSSLSIALKLERDSFEYYGKLSEELGDRELSDFFSRLSEWEKGHYEAIHREIALLEEEYYRANNFEPF